MGLDRETRRCQDRLSRARRCRACGYLKGVPRPSDCAVCGCAVESVSLGRTMPNEPLALPQILAGLPDEAGYDAVHAALTATERGRRFLTEYADRNRHADTTAIVSAIARIEVTLRGDGPPRADAAGDLMEIAAAIDRIGAALAAGATPAPGISAAIERLLDIAFMLHERPVEATLCDGLDAAIREISEANMRSESTAEGIREAAELVGALAGRVREMIA